MSTTMNILNEEKDEVLLGSGYLYAMDSETFNWTNFNVSNMDELGYIEDSATFSKEREMREITSANYGTVDTIPVSENTTFSTNIMSYDATKVSKYLTGSYVKTDGNAKTTYFAKGDRAKPCALVFVGRDDDSGNVFTLVMPKCRWIGNYTLDFNNENPVTLDFSFKCLDTVIGKDAKNNNIIGTAFIYENKTATTDGE